MQISNLKNDYPLPNIYYNYIFSESKYSNQERDSIEYIPASSFIQVDSELKNQKIKYSAIVIVNKCINIGKISDQQLTAHANQLRFSNF